MFLDLVCSDAPSGQIGRPSIRKAEVNRTHGSSADVEVRAAACWWPPSRRVLPDFL
jgi:hypothetical protein